MHDTTRTANLLGATALTVADLATTAARRAAGVSESGAAALVVLAESPRISVTELGRRIGLSQPAAARMVDTLESAGLVRRRPGSGREVTVALTAPGGRKVPRLLAARREPLADLVSALDDAEQAQLDELLGKLLGRIHAEVGSAARVCRLCDRSACVRRAVCPVGQAERDREG